MESAVKEHKLQFHFVHEPDGARIGYQKICKAEDKPVPDDEIVKAFELEKERWVYLTDEDFESAELDKCSGRSTSRRSCRRRRSTDLLRADVLPRPAGRRRKTYALLARALEKTGLVAVATFVMRDREHLACLRVRDGVIQLERMHFADEVRPTKGLARRASASRRRSSTWP